MNKDQFDISIEEFDAPGETHEFSERYKKTRERNKQKYLYSRPQWQRITSIAAAAALFVSSLLARNIAAVTGRTLVDLDIAFAEKFGRTPAEVISESGEDEFREMECEIAAEFLPKSGLVVSCGGGVVTRDVNKFYVRCNSNVFYLERPLTAVPTSCLAVRPKLKVCMLLKRYLRLV